MTRLGMFAATFALALTTGAAHAGDAVKACSRLKDDLVKMLQGDKARNKTYANNRLTPGGSATFKVETGGAKWQWLVRSNPIPKNLQLDAVANPRVLPKQAAETGVLYTACEFFASADAGSWKDVKSPSQILLGDASRSLVSARTVNAPLAGEPRVTGNVLPTRVILIQLHTVDEKKTAPVTVSLKLRPKATASR